jgi:hypothetical protein
MKEQQDSNTTTKDVPIRQVISLDLSEFIGCSEWGPMKKQ